MSMNNIPLQTCEVAFQPRGEPELAAAAAAAETAATVAVVAVAVAVAVLLLRAALYACMYMMYSTYVCGQ